MICFRHSHIVHPVCEDADCDCQIDARHTFVVAIHSLCGVAPEPWIMHYVVQSLANEVPALFLPSAIFGHIRSGGALLLCVVSWAGLSFICFSR